MCRNLGDLLLLLYNKQTNNKSYMSSTVLQIPNVTQNQKNIINIE